MTKMSKILVRYFIMTVSYVVFQSYFIKDAISVFITSAIQGFMHATFDKNQQEQDSFTTCFKTCGTNSWVLLRGFKKGSFSKSLKTVQKGVKKMFKKTQRGCPTGS